MGVIAGRTSGVLGGILVSLPALGMHEFMNLPMNVIAGFVTLRRDVFEDGSAATQW